jgi:hypothetical protein
MIFIKKYFIVNNIDIGTYVPISKKWSFSHTVIGITQNIDKI